RRGAGHHRAVRRAGGARRRQPARGDRDPRCQPFRALSGASPEPQPGAPGRLPGVPGRRREGDLNLAASAGESLQGTREMEQSALIEIGLPIALAIIMTGMGMTLVPSDFQRVVARPKALIWGALAALLLLPALSIVLAMALRLPAEMAVGLVIIAACPIGTTSNLIAFLARGRLALSIALTVVGSLATIVTLPLFANFALE